MIFLKHKNWILILYIILACYPFLSFADEFIQISPDQQFEYAQKLFSDDNFLEAACEYRRFIHFFPDDSRKDQAMFQIGMSYFKNGQYEDAIEAFMLLTEDSSSNKGIKTEFSEDHPAVQAYFMISETYMLQKESGQAVASLRNLLMLTENKDIQDKAFYKVGWIFLETGAWEKAGFFFSKISPENKEKYNLDKLNKELNKADNIALKNPSIAGSLSIIPGAGFLYCNRYRDALSAFVLNTGLMLAAYKAFDNDNPALGSIISLIEIGFYTGNIYGAVSSAHKFNRNTKKRFFERLKENTKVRLSHTNQDNGIMLSLDYNF